MRLQGHQIAILVDQGVEDLEYFVPLMRLEEEGADVLSVGTSVAQVQGKNGLDLAIDTSIDEVDADRLTGLVIPGGWAPDRLRRSTAVVELVRRLHDAGKPIGIICHGGLVAISARIVAGRRATGSLGIKDDLVNAGATWVDEPAFRDGNLIWGRVVADIPDFCRELVAAFVERAPQSSVIQAGQSVPV